MYLEISIISFLLEIYIIILNIVQPINKRTNWNRILKYEIIYCIYIIYGKKYSDTNV